MKFLRVALLLSAILALLSLTALLLRAQWTLEEMRLLNVGPPYAAHDGCYRANMNTKFPSKSSHLSASSSIAAPDVAHLIFREFAGPDRRAVNGRMSSLVSHVTHVVSVSTEE